MTTNAAESLRVLHLLDHSLPEQDGYSFRTAAILREQRARGWQTMQVTSAKHPAGELLSENIDALEYQRTPGSQSLLARLPVLDQIDVIRTLERHVKQLIVAFRPDIIQAHSPCLTGIAALRAAAGQQIPVVYEMRSSWEDAAVDMGVTRKGSLRYRLSRGLENYVLRSVAAVTTICDGLKQDIISRGIPENKVTVIPNAVDASQFAVNAELRRQIIQQFGDENTRLIGFIGSFFSWEGLGVLIDAMNIMARQRKNIRLLLVGGGAEEQMLRQKVAALGIDDQVVFVGRVPHDQVSSYYAAMDLLVYPRIRCELNDKVTPLKPLEAMAHRALVLASDVGGHRELVTDGRNGLLFSADDAAVLCAAIIAALEHPEREDIRDAGYGFVTSDRTWEKSIAGYDEVYRAALGSSSPC